MKFSIITPSLNQADYISDTIESVMNQNYTVKEHIIIDGGSTDDTVNILKKYPHLKWISEKDTGQSNAINKGLEMASGEIVAWINSDDYYEKDIFPEIACYFSEHPECMILYGDITYISKNKEFMYKLSGDVVSFESLLKIPDLVRQPATFWRKSLMDEVGLLNEDLHLVMDYEFFLRASSKHKFHYLGRNLCYFRCYNENKTNSLLGKQAKELYGIFKSYNVMDYYHYKFLLGRYLDSLPENSIVRNLFSIFRKEKNEKNTLHRS